MTSDHDAGVVAELVRSRSSARVEADDPVAVARAVATATGARLVPAPEAPSWAAEARSLRTLAERVRAAEAVVAGARAAEQAAEVARIDADAVLQDVVREPAPVPGTSGDGAAADRQALRFALVILVVSQVAGAAVYVVDGDLLAVSAPAVALVVVAGIVLAHRRPLPGRDRPAALRPPADPVGDAVVEPTGPPLSPAVRAAEAHLRRQQAAWKLAWWERGLAPVAVADWSSGPAGAALPATLVVVDDGGELDGALHAELAAAVPGSVRVVSVVPRASPAAGSP